MNFAGKTHAHIFKERDVIAEIFQSQNFDKLSIGS
jgi:hypothetical protein